MYFFQKLFYIPSQFFWNINLKSTLNFYIILLLTLQFELVVVIMLFMFLTNVERISIDSSSIQNQRRLQNLGEVDRVQEV